MLSQVTFFFALFLGNSVVAEIPPEYIKAANTKNIPPAIFYAIAKTESLYKYKHPDLDKAIYQPWPWSLNINGVAFRFDNRLDAFDALQGSISNGESVDAGIMQINWRWHKHRFDQPWSILDPHKNLEVAATILREQYERSLDWWSAVGAYHAPGNDDISRQRAERYRDRVRKHWRLINKEP